MGMWDVLAVAANLAQLSGLHAVMLVTVATSLLRITQSTRECAKLEQCVRKLHAVLAWPTGYEIVMQSSEMADRVSKALKDAKSLIDSYHRSTLWGRVQRSRSMARELQEMQNCINSYFGLVLFINAHLVIQEAIHPPSDITNGLVDDDQSQCVQAVTQRPTAAETCAIPDTRRVNSTGQERISSQPGNSDTRCEIVPASCEIDLNC